jgi:alanyl-tRNA synthetase
MTAQEIRRAYLEFFTKRDHAIIPRALLVPQNDPTTLFTGSGMQPLIPYLLGQKHPHGIRLVNSQTCFRADDIDEVGDNRHTTFFEMLGNWSLGDYFKEQQIPWFWEFLTEIVKIDPNKLYVTCYSGDEKFNIPKDTEAAEIWKKLFKAKGIETKEAEMYTEFDGYKIGMKPGERIFYYRDKNWWSRAGEPKNMPPGEPGGPDTEVFFDVGSQHDPKYGEHCHPNCDCGRWIEVGNSVFMQYLKNDKAGFDELPNKNVDFGGGLERIASASIGGSDMFKISLLWPVVEKLKKLSGKSYDSNTESMRVITDHLRAAIFLAVDGVTPSNKEQGYVMRRLIRRAVRFAFDLGIEQNFLEQIMPVIADLYHEDYPEVAKNREKVIETLVKEEKVFRQTLRKGLHEFQRDLGISSSGTVKPKDELTGERLFKLYDTFGFPVELSKEEALKRDIDIAKNADEEFERLMQEQRKRSQTASKGTFKGGLGGQTLQHKKYHTATHLMYQALRDVLGDHVVQNGSNITEERLRFDFSHPEKMKPEQIKKVEDIVNDQIKNDLVVTWKEYPTKVAIEEKHALGQFGDRYSDMVKVYSMQAKDADKPFSFEICGGPHVDHTAQLAEDGKKFKIIKEESSAAGIRRIKAVLI